MIPHAARAGWSSSGAVSAWARGLPGQDPAASGAWLSEQAARVGDPAFAELFRGAAEALGLPVAMFAHRVVAAGDLRLLSGIRFLKRDTERPFVELLAWDGAEAPSPEGWRAVRAALAEAWAAFEPRAVRLLHPTGLPLPEDAALDMGVHAAPYRAMATPPAPRDVRVLPLTDPEAAQAIVAARYDELRRAHPALARDVEPAGEAEIREAVSAGRALGVAVEGETVGLLAWEPGSVEWIAGDVVIEEVVLARASGRGLAAVLQSALARRRAAEAPDTPLIGTIHHANHASRRTALRAGRPEIGRYSFLPLRGRRP